MEKIKFKALNIPREIKIFIPEDSLKVVHAVSSFNSIRFYVNNNQYFIGYDNDCNVYFQSDSDNDERNQDLQSRKTRIKNLFLTIALGILTIIIVSFTTIMLGNFIHHVFYLIVSAAINSILMLIYLVACISLTTPTEIKSKHAAEHMMVNFMEKHNRLPRTLDELKKSSRFSADCGTRKTISIAANNFVLALLGIIAGYPSLYFIDNTIIKIIVYLIIYNIVYSGMNNLVQPNGKLYFLVSPITYVFNFIGQLGNTTSKVQDKDLYLAYRVCFVWIQFTYSHLFDEEKDNGI